MKDETMFVDKTTFRTLFSEKIKKEIEKTWPDVVEFLQENSIKAALDLFKREMSVETTKKIVDPCSILFARDLINLLSRGVPLSKAKCVFDEGVSSEVVFIDSFVSNQKTFIKRRERIVGKNDSTLKAIQLLTGCFLWISGKTVSIVGPQKGIKETTKIVVGCMKNKHPVYSIKELMIKKELEKDESLKSESWNRFLPKFKKKQIKKKAKIEEKKQELFPVPPPKRKEDLMMESGEYFLAKKKKKSF